MKWTVSFWRTAKWGGWQAFFFIGKGIKYNEEINKKYLIGWGHRVNLIWGEKTQNWIGVWGLAD